MLKARPGGAEMLVGASLGGVIPTAPMRGMVRASPGQDSSPPAHSSSVCSSCHHQGFVGPRELTLQPGSRLWAASQGPAAARRALAAPGPSWDHPPCYRGWRQPRFPLPRCLAAPWHTKCSVWSCIFPLNALEEKERDRVQATDFAARSPSQPPPSKNKHSNRTGPQL